MPRDNSTSFIELMCKFIEITQEASHLIERQPAVTIPIVIMQGCILMDVASVTLDKQEDSNLKIGKK